MSENLFSFPGEDTVPAGGDIFSDINLAGLGSDDSGEDPFADMHASEPSAATEQTAPAAQSHADTSAESQVLNQLEPQAADLSAAPQAASVSTTQPQTPLTPQAAEDANPLLAAMELQDQKNARQAAAPIFAQLPVFSYNGNEEPIENTEQTFEELRLAKADDFPEFDEAQSISWTVTYGKISKNVSTPRKIKIGDFKREIESSKEFMDALKKAADKHPKCLVKPVVKMQKKGVLSSYKGIFPHLEDARASGKTICFIPSQDGHVYERRVNEAGEFITPTSGVTYLDDIRAGFTPALPRIPYALMEQTISLFRHFMSKGTGTPSVEALVNVYWDKAEQCFFLHVPRQYVGEMFVDAVQDDNTLLDETRYFHYADIHSHNSMPAKFSRIDDRDERANRIYMVVGRLDRYYPEISARICNGGHFCKIHPEQVLEPMPQGDFPAKWLERISSVEDAGKVTA